MTLTARLFGPLVKSGRLTVIHPDGARETFGNAHPDFPDVTIRLEKGVMGRMLANPALGAAEAYMDGALEIIEGDVWGLATLYTANAQAKAKRKSATGRAVKRARNRLLQWNGIVRSRRNVAHHYDLGNEFYRLFLDADMQYSCAYFPERGLSLEEAQRAKKAHIAAKLASTFASTGTPSFFVHPTEASHGDLGMISPQDLVLMISHSGETKELHDIIAYCKRFSLKLIAMTGDADSLLARAATVSLILPAARESCPLNLAPTTSSLMQLALGDALAVSLVERRGFSEGNFRDFHPGGKLGASLIPVRELMLVDGQVPLLPASHSIMQGLDLLTEKSVGIIGVVDEDEALTGVVTDPREYVAEPITTGSAGLV